MAPWVSFAISVAFVVGIIIASLLWRREVRRREAMELAASAGGIPFAKAGSVFSDADKSIYPVLVWAMAKEGQVLCKVNLGELVTLPKSVDRREFHLRLVNSRTVDFVICQNETFAPALAILVGNPSLRGERGEDQALAEQVCSTAGLPVLWLSPRQSYMPHEIKAMIKDAIRGSPAGDSTPAAPGAPGVGGEPGGSGSGVFPAAPGLDTGGDSGSGGGAASGTASTPPRPTTGA